MKISDAMVTEFRHEAAGTRRMLERLPEDKLTFKPHEKSMSLGELATHIAHIPTWIQTTVNDDFLDMSTVGRTQERKSRQEILDYFDENVETFEKTLSGQPDEHLFQHWKLKNKEEILVDMPRVACIRGFILSHIIHHRGQLSVYLRENDVPLPAIYGPSADEGM